MKRYYYSVGYSLSSLSTTILNKYILLNFNRPFLLVVIQSIIICLVLILGVLTNLCKLRFLNLKKWLIPSLFLNVMIFTGTKTLQYLPISLFTLFKNGSIIIVAFIEYLIFTRTISKLESISFLLMVSSSYLGDTSDNIQVLGYIWTVLNILSTTIYVVSLRYVINNRSSSTVEAIFFPNILAIPLIGLLSWIFENGNVWMSENVNVFILLSSICALLTALTTSLVLKHLSSTTFSMIGAFNKIIMGFSGLVFLNEEYNLLKIYSLLLGSLSSLLYIDNLRRKDFMK